MKTLIVLCICYAFVIADGPISIDSADFYGVSLGSGEGLRYLDRIPIDSLGNIRAVLGSQGKSIAVSGGGEAIAVFYGMPSGDPNNSMLAKVAYSLNGGSSWTTYGPFSGAARRLYNDIACTPDFDANSGELWFCFQENTQGYNDGQISVMIEENLPSAPSFSVPIIPMNAQPPVMYPWEPSIVVAPDDPTYLVATAWSYLVNGNEWAYCWISTDGGYSWTDTIPMAYINADGNPGAISAGSGGHIFYAYVDYYTFSGSDSTPYPYYMESTNGGYTWSAETPITVFPANTSSQYWWHEFDCLVIDNEPWVVFNDIGIGGAGGPHIAKATGSPGNWTWDIWHQDSIGFDSTWVGDTLFHCWPSQYPSLSYDPVLGRVLASCKSYCYIGNTLSWATLDGAHIQGVYTQDDGNTWRITGPLSTPNNGEIMWEDWNATETADRMVNSMASVSTTYSIWVHEDPSTEAGIVYFEYGMLGYWFYDWPTSIEEARDLSINIVDFAVIPSVATTTLATRFTMPIAGHVSMSLYDVSGRLVEDVFDGYLNQGTHKMYLCTDHLSNGTYFVVLQTEAGQQVEKFVVVR